jgi:N-dimethylarginine dimethylaminohydrolase
MSISSCHVNDEWSQLKAVVVGIADSWGPDPLPEEAVDPKSREHILAGTYPSESDVLNELNKLASLLESEGITVYRPEIVNDLNQVFARDVGIVIGNKFLRTSMIADRAPEWEGIAPIVAEIGTEHFITPPNGVRFEGGDVMPMGNEIWVGFGDAEDFDQYKTARTNDDALIWLGQTFPNNTIRSFALSKSDTDPRLNALHLDCCICVLGYGHAIFHPDGMKNEEDREFIRKKFDGKLLEVDAEAMYHMNCNLFSIAPDTVISSTDFDSVNEQLTNWGYRVLTTPMYETSKMEGLLRCVTLPLIRE